MCGQEDKANHISQDINVLKALERAQTSYRLKTLKEVWTDSKLVTDLKH